MSAHNRLALTPPLGWNSYDCYGCSVREAEVRANAEYMAQHLSRFGWQYIVIDGEWADREIKAGGCRPNATLEIDEYCRLIPAISRFPSAAGGQGFEPLADYIHSLGLKFGIHIMRGIPRPAVERNLSILGTDSHAQGIADTSSTCTWNTDMYGVDMSKPGAQAYYDSIIALYAGWGVDFIKADDMSLPYYPDEIAALSQAIEKTGRDIVLSLSPGDSEDVVPPNPKKVAHLINHCEMWRVSSDLWDRWKDIKTQFTLCSRWSPYAGPGHWPDADMLPLGRLSIRGVVGTDRMTDLTQDEQFTLMTLWCVARSPLMLGGDLPSNDDFTLSLITNREVLAVNQTSTGSRELFRRGDQVVWSADLPDTSDKALAVFNLSDDSAESIKVALGDLGLGGLCTAHDLWTKQELGTVEDTFTCTLRPHAAALYRIGKLK